MSERWIAIAAMFVLGCASSKSVQKDRPPEDAVVSPSPTKDETETDAPPETSGLRCDLPETSSWAQFQGGSDRLGRADTPAIESPRIRWSLEVGVQSWLNNPIIVGDMVIVGSSGLLWNKPDGADGVYAVDLATGKLRWFQPSDSDVNGVGYANCLIITTGDSGSVHALLAQTGEEYWSWQSGASRVYTNPLIIENRVVVGDSDGGLHALELTSGNPLWTVQLDGAIRGGASTDGERVFAGSDAGQIAAIDLDDGTMLWQLQPEEIDPNAGEVYATPTVLPDRVIFSYSRDTAYERPALIAVAPEDGAVLWRATNTGKLTGGWGNIRSSPAVHDDLLIWAEPYSNRVVAASARSGDVVWSVPHGVCLFPHWPSPLVVGETAYVGRSDGGLYALDPATGSPRWSMYLGRKDAAGAFFPEQLQQTSWNRCEWSPPTGKAIFASPAVAGDGTVIVGTGDGVLYAIENDAGEARSE